MFKKFFVMGLAALVLNLSLATLAAAETPEAKAAKHAEKVKTNVTKLGTGKDARIEVKLDNGTKLKGYVSQINDTSFVVTTDSGNDCRGSLSSSETSQRQQSFDRSEDSHRRRNSSRRPNHLWPRYPLSVIVGNG
jgi:hypothetical protein